MTPDRKIEGKEEKKKAKTKKDEEEENDANGKKKDGGGSSRNSTTTPSTSSLPSLPSSSASSIPAAAAAAAAAAAPGTQKETMDLDRVAIHHLTLVLAPLALGFAARYGQMGGEGGWEGGKEASFYQVAWRSHTTFLIHSLLPSSLPPYPNSSLLQEEYTGWYSWALSTLTSAVYTFG